MCGIAGACWTAGAEPLDESVVARMIAVLSHRGPDADGIHVRAPHGRAGVALGHRRLSIIDVDGSPQPMPNDDESVWITFNGEVYNYVELRDDLRARGYEFQTDGDTEVLLRLYEEYGEACVEHVRGMFAFAIWDARSERLLLARDRLGQKPLVYRVADGRITFASELKALLQIPGAPRDPSPLAIALYLAYQYVPHPYCILRGYTKLPPGHLAVFEGGVLRVREYWSAPFTEPPPEENGKPWKTDRWKRELRERLTESVRLRMRSDVPVGSFLSGGIDSTIVSGLMQRLNGSPIHTFSIGFSEANYDERSYAREVATTIGSKHHEHVVEASALQTLPKLLWHYDEPFADSSAIPTMALARRTREHVTVALSGDGGDELFAGYGRYRAVNLAGNIDRFPRFVRRMMGWSGWQRIPTPIEQGSYLRRAKRFLSVIEQSPERRYLNWIAIFDPHEWRGLYSDDFRDRLRGRDVSDFLVSAYSACPERDFVTRTTCTDVRTYLPCDILTKVDIATMAHGLECRSPFLDHPVAELAARMPIDLKLRGSTGKWLLRETFADLIPHSIANRAKMGFGVPLARWFRGELRDLVVGHVLDRRALERGIFDEATLKRIVDEHLGGHFDHGARLWSLLVLECWFRTWIDGDVPTAPAPVARRT